MNDPFGRGAIPRHMSRAGRVELLAEAARLLLQAGGEAALFVGSALQSWLREGGDLARDRLRVAAPRGSQHTPQRLAARLIIGDERQGASDPGPCEYITQGTDDEE